MRTCDLKNKVCRRPKLCQSSNANRHEYYKAKSERTPSFEEQSHVLLNFIFTSSLFQPCCQATYSPPRHYVQRKVPASPYCVPQWNKEFQMWARNTAQDCDETIREDLLNDARQRTRKPPGVVVWKKYEGYRDGDFLGPSHVTERTHTVRSNWFSAQPMGFFLRCRAVRGAICNFQTKATTRAQNCLQKIFNGGSSRLRRGGGLDILKIW